MKRKLQNILVTGGAGFIGSNFIRYMFSPDTNFEGKIVNLDLLTYAGNLESLEDIQAEFGNFRYFFEKADIQDKKAVQQIMQKYDIDTIVHFAAESHVDRSILSPDAFMKTNVMGTFVLLEVAKDFWQKDGKMRDDVLFHHISTDEVYGSLGDTGYFSETTPYSPRSPYSASKASSDHLVFSYHHTYKLPVTLTNCTNNYGPYQFPEKFLPLMILNIKEGKPLPVYGQGKNIRDWVYVEDHNRAVYLVMQKGCIGQKYNIGGENEWHNIDLLERVIELESAILKKDKKDIQKTITFIKDRPGHDLRYAIDCTKIKTQLGWRRTVSFEKGLENTINWYLSHADWVKHIESGEYKNWLAVNYQKR